MIEIICDVVNAKLDKFKDSRNYTPLTLAIKLALHEIVNYLSLRGYDLNQEDPDHQTILMYYILNPEHFAPDDNLKKMPSFRPKLLKAAKQYVNRGADVNRTSPEYEYGSTLLIQAIKLSKIDAIGFLLDHGANPHIEDMSGMDACDHAIKTGLSDTFPDLGNCNHSLRIRPHNIKTDYESDKLVDIPKP